MIFVNLPVTDLAASVAFCQAPGFEKNPQFSDHTAACMIGNETISVMLLSHNKWNGFTTRPVRPSMSSEVSLALALDDRDAVDAMSAAAAAHGGTADINPVQDPGFMYGRDLTDPDGEVLGPFWMDTSAMAAGGQGASEQSTANCEPRTHRTPFVGSLSNYGFLRGNRPVAGLDSGPAPVTTGSPRTASSCEDLL